MKRIILFDGECNFCDQSVQFILQRDPSEYFRFASLESEAGQQLLKEYGAPTDLDSFVLIEGDRYYTASTAALRVCRKLTGFWSFLYVFRFIPSPLRDRVYRFIADNRYKWFGKKEQCFLPTPKERDRFL